MPHIAAYARLLPYNDASLTDHAHCGVHLHYRTAHKAKPRRTRTLHTVQLLFRTLPGVDRGKEHIMLRDFLQRLAALLLQERIGYTELQSIITDLLHLSDADLDTLITRWDAIHRLLLALRAKRQSVTGTSGIATQSEVR
jgi:hypothetical protein